MKFFKREQLLLLFIFFIPFQYRYRKPFHGLAKSIREGIELNPSFMKSIHFYTTDIILIGLLLFCLSRIKKFFSHPSCFYLLALMIIALISISGSFTLHYFRWFNV